MVTPAVGEVVLVRFAFSDLSQSKLRPAVYLADAVGSNPRTSIPKTRTSRVTTTEHTP
jgi:hypothetical protein